MLKTIIAINQLHLKSIIDEEISKYGNECDLNHIDVSQVTHINALFSQSKFNGDISKWNVSNVKEMNWLFFKSDFNGDISNWEVSKVEWMRGSFSKSKFNGDISKWNVSNTAHMSHLFEHSQFKHDLSNWKPFNLQDKHDIFLNCSAPTPYWVNLSSGKEIKSHHLFNQLKNQLPDTINDIKQLKI